MFNRIWMWAITQKARFKDAVGLKTTNFEDFLLEIRLY